MLVYYVQCFHAKMNLVHCTLDLLVLVARPRGESWDLSLRYDDIEFSLNLGQDEFFGAHVCPPWFMVFWFMLSGVALYCLSRFRSTIQSRPWLKCLGAKSWLLWWISFWLSHFTGKWNWDRDQSGERCWPLWINESWGSLITWLDSQRRVNAVAVDLGDSSQI